MTKKKKLNLKQYRTIVADSFNEEYEGMYKAPLWLLQRVEELSEIALAMGMEADDVVNEYEAWCMNEKEEESDIANNVEKYAIVLRNRYKRQRKQQLDEAKEHAMKKKVEKGFKADLEKTTRSIEEASEDREKMKEDIRKLRRSLTGVLAELSEERIARKSLTSEVETLKKARQSLTSKVEAIEGEVQILQTRAIFKKPVSSKDFPSTPLMPPPNPRKRKISESNPPASKRDRKSRRSSNLNISFDGTDFPDE